MTSLDRWRALSTCAFLLFSEGCRSDPPGQTAARTRGADAESGRAGARMPAHPNLDSVAVATARLACTPTRVARGDTVILVMTTPHGQYLGATGPTGDWYFIIHPEPSAPPLRSLMPSQSFRNVDTLRLPVPVPALLRSVEAVGRESLFVAPGSYVLKLGENLESDDYWPVAECRVVVISQD